MNIKIELCQVIIILISRFLKRYLKAKRTIGTGLFTSAATNQRGGVYKGGSREAQVRFPEY